MPPPTTIQHHPPPTTIHHNPPPAKIYSPQSTATHHYPRPATIHPPLSTTIQKMDYHPAKAKTYSYIASFGIVLTVSFSSKCNISVMEILCDKVLISSFFRFKISTTFYVFKIFWSLYFNSLRLLNTNRVSNQKRPITIFSFKWQFNVF